MKAITYHEYGPPDVLSWADRERPVPRAGEVLMRVEAASLNQADLFMMRGTPRLGRLAFGLRRPRRPVLGRAAAGTVVETGPGVSELQAGDEVFGELDQGAFAEYAVAPVRRLTRKPATVTFEQAATLPVAATTALQGVRLTGAGPGSRLLVNGASGGVGTFAVQLAKAAGAHVTGVCSTRNAELVRSIGADRVVDYTREDVTHGEERFDAVFDLVNSHPLAVMRRILTPAGTYVGSSGNGGPVLGPMPRVLAAAVLSPFVRQRLRSLVATADTADAAEVAALVAAGTVTPVIEATRPLREAVDAIRQLERAHARGKVVLTP
ncbi:NAD(P)-dependent alcohol dehydrogenase [Actinoplanes friuliensis]|uniref:Alcohol dehydrogenase n=1 Tax=Actinoplanes friuliensis DSM 7358 TaxID=1246995 RepID=U5VYW1_9ACTN|nr:NAD(P)-dependent alcohol dehydrogenase [Actinoplanes friuliensis]AGZ42153.1 alcohol dehydrogenase [Actinoplanes friuliensis DSM 7358]